MTRGKPFLTPDSTEWLLEESNPSVRYFTLTDLLGRTRTDPEVMRSRQAIMRTGIVPQILPLQRDGSWNSPKRFYLDKYRGTVWQLIILAEHAADGGDPRIRKACEYVLRCSQDPESHGFAYNQRAGGAGGLHSQVIPCLTGNMVWSLLKLGYGEDERVRKGVDWITRYQRFDDAVRTPPSGWPYDKFEMCWGRHSCHMGVVKSLKALSAVPQGRRDRKINETIKRGCEYLLAHHVYKRSHDLAKASKPGWLKLQFPLMYQTDILEVAGLLLDLGCRDERMSDAIRVIGEKRNADGRWTLDSTFNGRFQADIEEKGRPSKWITYRALRVLKGYSG